MLALTGYHLQLIEVSTDLVNHGFGDMVLKVSSLKDNTVKIEVLSGKHYVFFVKKTNQIQNENII